MNKLRQFPGTGVLRPIPCPIGQSDKASRFGPLYCNCFDIRTAESAFRNEVSVSPLLDSSAPGIIWAKTLLDLAKSSIRTLRICYKGCKRISLRRCPGRNSRFHCPLRTSRDSNVWVGKDNLRVFEEALSFLPAVYLGVSAVGDSRGAERQLMRFFDEPKKGRSGSSV